MSQIIISSSILTHDIIESIFSVMGIVLHLNAESSKIEISQKSSIDLSKKELSNILSIVYRNKLLQKRTIDKVLKKN